MVPTNVLCVLCVDIKRERNPEEQTDKQTYEGWGRARALLRYSCDETDCIKLVGYLDAVTFNCTFDNMMIPSSVALIP